MPRSQTFVEIDADDLRGVAEQHFSVHHNSGSLDTVITFKQKFSDGTHLSDVMYIHETKQHLLWPIYARQVGISDESKRRCPPIRSKDSYFSLGCYSSKTATLCFAAFVTRPNDILDLGSLTANCMQISFQNFKIHVVWSFFNVPSPPFGNITSFITSSRVANHLKQDGHLQFYRTSRPLSLLSDDYLILLAILKGKMKADILSGISKGGMADKKLIDDIDMLLSHTTALPVLSDLDM